MTKTTAYTEVSYNAANATWTLSGLDTTKINSGKDSKECYIRVVFTDNYGNKSSGSLKLTVDQDADRPVIELTTITAMNDVIPLKKASRLSNILIQKHVAQRASSEHMPENGDRQNTGSARPAGRPRSCFSADSTLAAKLAALLRIWKGHREFSHYP